MQTALIILSVLLGIIVIGVLWGIAIYNHLITLKNRFVNAFAQIDVQLQRRYDLIPNLTETAKKYMSYEQETLDKIIQARNGAKEAAQQAAQNPSDAKLMEKLNIAESGLTSGLGRLFALVENYPDLKANQTMQQLMEELTTTENKISFARQAFNDAVMFYNTYRTQFPPVIIAGLFQFTQAQHFEVSNPEVKEAVKLKF